MATPMNHPSNDAPAAPRRILYYLIATFVVAGLFALGNIVYVVHSRVETKRNEARVIAQGYAQRIQVQIQNTMISTYVLASVVRQVGGIPSNFDETAAELLTMFPGASAIQLAPDGVIRSIFPLNGNEAAMGHDLLSDKQRNREAVAAITTRQLTLAGPFDLIQGGVGAVGRLPIFLANGHKETRFWGFATALIRIPRLMESAGFNSLTRAGYHYELWRIHPDSGLRHVIAKNTEQALDNPVDYVVTIYGGHWILSLAPEKGWVSGSEALIMLGFSLGAVVLITLLQYLCIRLFLLRKERSAAVGL